MVGNLRPTVLVLMGGVGFMLLIACTSVASLHLARGEDRKQEIATRTALGATPLADPLSGSDRKPGSVSGWRRPRASACARLCEMAQSDRLSRRRAARWCETRHACSGVRGGGWSFDRTALRPGASFEGLHFG
jgi:hypothetical protein